MTRRIYVVVGELENSPEIDIFYGAYLTMEKADEVCYELEQNKNDNHIYYYVEVILDEES